MSKFQKLSTGVSRQAQIQGTDIGSGAATSSQFLAADGSGNSAFRTIAFTDLSGSVTSSQLPAFTGDVTTSAGSSVTTVAKIAGVSVGTPTGTGNVVFSNNSTFTGTVGFAAISATSTIEASSFITTAANTASTGVIRMGSADAIKWRNNASNGDVALAKNTSDQLTYAGTAILSSTGILLASAFPALTGDVTTSAGSLATTVAAIQGTTVSGTTGSTNVMFSASPTTTGTLTAAAITASGLITPTGGVKGISGGGNVAAGNVGQYIESVISSATSIPGSSAQWGDLTSITLSPGDWDVTATMALLQNAASINYGYLGLSTHSGNDSTGLTIGITEMPMFAPTSLIEAGTSIPSYRISTSGSPIVYAKAYVSYSGTPQYTCRLSARRVSPGT